MKSRIILKPQQKTENLIVVSADMPGQIFNYHIPEAIGSTDVADTYFSTADKKPARPDWTPMSDGGWTYRWTQPQVCSFTVEAVPREDYVDVRIKLKNLSEKNWPESAAFSCYNFNKAIQFSDFEGTRTFLLVDGQWKSLIQIERKDSPRPLVQLFYVKGKPQPLGCVEHFKATSPVRPAGVFAVRSYDGKSVTAVTADKSLYLFHNLEYSCIHCCPGFGPLQPGQQAEVTNRVFIVKDITLDEIATRARKMWV
ncbi:MAG: hypothetical protein ACYTF1_18995 [Planctomycetota bacterium]|jgi:hypothetical protein